jgi:hypothetical protein
LATTFSAGFGSKIFVSSPEALLLIKGGPHYCKIDSAWNVTHQKLALEPGYSMFPPAICAHGNFYIMGFRNEVVEIRADDLSVSSEFHCIQV